jgi:hypothetical protein
MTSAPGKDSEVATEILPYNLAEHMTDYPYLDFVTNEIKLTLASVEGALTGQSSF